MQKNYPVNSLGIFKEVGSCASFGFETIFIVVRRAFSGIK